VDDAIGFWVAANGCEGTGSEELLRGGVVRRTTWTGCRGGGAVESWQLEGWGHQWPAGHFTETLGFDEPLRGFDATGLIWDYFQRFRRTEE